MDDEELARLRERSEAALERIETAAKKTKDDWWEVGEFLVALISQTLNEIGLNTPNGKAWAKAFGPKLRSAPRLARIKAGTRTRLKFCMEHRPEIEDWLVKEDLCQLNHPDAIYRRFKKEMLEPDQEKRTKPTKMELQQAANLELQDQLDFIRKTLGVETTDDAVLEVQRLMNEGCVLQTIKAPQVAQQIEDLKHELSQATFGLSNTTGELEKNKAQQSKQAETITTLIERVKQAAILLRSLQGSSGDLAQEVERWLAADSEQLAERTEDHYSDSLKTNTEPAEPPAETITEPPQKRKRGRPPRDRSNDPPPPPKRPRGRPRKDRSHETVLQQERAEVAEAEQEFV